MEKQKIADNSKNRDQRQSSPPRAETPRFLTHIDIPQQTRYKMIALLNQQLADMFDIYSHTKQAHWNVKGPNFYQLHLLFDEVAEELLGYIDMIAERATALGGVALGTVHMAAAASHMPEYPEDVFEDMEVVAAFVDQYSRLAKSVREAIDTAEQAEDMGTSDLFIEVSRGLDKRLWFLEAHLQK